jgi:hypothetical protein
VDYSILDVEYDGGNSALKRNKYSNNQMKPFIPEGNLTPNTSRQSPLNFKKPPFFKTKSIYLFILSLLGEDLIATENNGDNQQLKNKTMPDSFQSLTQDNLLRLDGDTINNNNNKSESGNITKSIISVKEPSGKKKIN